MAFITYSMQLSGLNFFQLWQALFIKWMSEHFMRWLSSLLCDPRILSKLDKIRLSLGGFSGFEIDACLIHPADGVRDFHGLGGRMQAQVYVCVPLYPFELSVFKC